MSQKLAIQLYKNLRSKDTLGTGDMSFVEGLSSSWRFVHYGYEKYPLNIASCQLGSTVQKPGARLYI